MTYLNEIIQKESLNDFINVKELNEIPEGSESLIFENLFSNLDRDFLIITRDLKRFQQIKDTMEFFLKSNALFFPQWDHDLPVRILRILSGLLRQVNKPQFVRTKISTFWDIPSIIKVMSSQL